MIVMGSQQLYKSNQGNALLQTLLAMFILGIISLGMLSMIQTMQKSRSILDLKMTLDNFRSETLKNITSSQARNATELDHTHFVKTCDPVVPPAIPGEGCSKEYEGVVKFLDENGDVFNDSTQLSAGFNFNGFPCNSFDPVNGNDQCPLRIEVRWRSACIPTDSTGTCYLQKKFYLVKFKYKPNVAKFSLNIGRYDFDETLISSAGGSNQVPDTKTICEKLGGTWVKPTAPRPEFCVMSDGWQINWF